MSAVDEGGGVRRRLIGWLSRQPGSDTTGAASAAAEGPNDAAAPSPGRLLDVVIAGLPDPVVVLDRDARVLAFNVAGELLGWRTGSLPADATLWEMALQFVKWTGWLPLAIGWLAVERRLKARAAARPDQPHIA